MDDARTPPRSASNASTKNGSASNGNTSAESLSGQAEKTARPQASTMACRTRLPAPSRPRNACAAPWRLQAINGTPASSAPTASPTIQLSQAWPTCATSGAPATRSHTTPLSDVTTMPSATAATKVDTSRRRSRRSSKPQCRSSSAASAVPAVLPAPTSSASHNGPPRDALAATAAAQTAKAIAGPQRRNAATAMPVGSHTSEMWVPT